MTEIRYYKGKYKVEILKKSKGNYLVKALEPILMIRRLSKTVDSSYTIVEGQQFVTVPRLLWKKPRK